MPKVIRRRKSPLSTEEKQSRRDRWNPSSGLTWIDPYPSVQGTDIEKRVYAFLMRIGIPFYFSTYLDVSLPIADIPNDWKRPDFIIPSLKITIEVQGSYWHSTEEQQYEDAVKAVMYEYAGYRPLAWWDYEILGEGVQALAMRDIPELNYYRGPRVGEVITENRSYIDDSAGASTMASKSKDWFNSRAHIKVRGSGKRKGVLTYEP